MGVVWMEPWGRGLRFPVYPESLTAGSDEHAFSMNHDIYSVYDVRFTKPIGDRGIFRFMFGDYPITNICYAEPEALAMRLYEGDLKASVQDGGGGNQNSSIEIRDSVSRSHRVVSNLTVTTRSGLVRSLEMFGDKHSVLKRVEYEYDDHASPPRLLRERVILPQTLMNVGLQSGSLKVAIGNTNYLFSEFPIVHEKGGRICTVEYNRIPLGKRQVSLPTSIEVYDGLTTNLLRSVSMTSFREMNLSSEQAEDAAEGFAGITTDYKDYQILLSNYWGEPLDHVTPADMKSIERLLDRFRPPSPRGNESIGEVLKRLNMQMNLSEMIGNDSDVEVSFQEYLKTLRENGLSGMLLDGGYGVVEWAMQWGRYREANRLLGIWLRTLSPVSDGEAALGFAESEIRKKDFWTCFRFLQCIPNDVCSSAGQRFERAAGMFVCLHRLMELFTNSPAVEDGFPRMQVEMARVAVSKDELERLAAMASDDAYKMLGTAMNLTDFQKAVKKQLQEIKEPLSETKAH
jgi:hypothetical protein